MKRTKIQEAYACADEARRVLIAAGARSMEVTEDRAGILWERLIVGPQGTSVILFATPHWWQVFAPIHSDQRETFAAIVALSKGGQ